MDLLTLYTRWWAAFGDRQITPHEAMLVLGTRSPTLAQRRREAW